MNLELTTIQSLARSRFGIEIGVSRLQRLAEHQLQLWQKQHQCNLAELVRRLQQANEDSSLVAEFISIITIGESYFFRHREQLETLIDWIKHHLQHRVRIWSAACSLGCEVYSLAYLLRQQNIPYYILGTDIDRSRLNVARNRGPFERFSVRGTEHPPPEMLRVRRHRYYVDDDFAKNVAFAYHNFHSDTYPTPPPIHGLDQQWDIIICRNAFIYFDKPQTLSILEKMNGVLHPNGSIWLSVNDALFDKEEVLFSHRWKGYTFLSKEQAPLVSRPKPVLPPHNPSPPRLNTPPIPAGPSTTSLQRYIEHNRLDLAITAAEQLQTTSSSAVLTLTLGALYARTHQFSKAEQVYQTLPKYQQTVEWSYLMGLLCYSQQQIAKAKEHFSQTVSSNPRHWAAQVYLGIILTKQRRWIKAELAFEEAQEVLQSKQHTLHFAGLIQPKGFHDSALDSLFYVEEQLRRLQT